MDRIGAVELLLEYMILSEHAFRPPQTVRSLMAFAMALEKRGFSVNASFKYASDEEVWSDDISDAVWFCQSHGCLVEAKESGESDVYRLPSEARKSRLKKLLEANNKGDTRIRDAFRELQAIG